MSKMISLFSRTRYMAKAKVNKLIFSIRCGNSKQTARSNPDFFMDRSLVAVAYFIAFCRHCLEVILRKVIYGLLFLLVPYWLLEHLVDGVLPYQYTVAYMFLMLNVLAGSLVNPYFYKVDKKERKFLKIIPGRKYWIDRLITGMFDDFVGFTVMFLVLGVRVSLSVHLSLMAVLARPVGELITYLLREKSRYFSRKYNTMVGGLMAVAVFLAYGLVLVKDGLMSWWFFLLRGYFVGIEAAVAVLAILVIVVRLDLELIGKRIK